MLKLPGQAEAEHPHIEMAMPKRTLIIQFPKRLNGELDFPNS